MVLDRLDDANEIRIRRLERITSSLFDDQQDAMRLLADHTSQMKEIGQRLDVIEKRLDLIEGRLDGLETRMDRPDQHNDEVELSMDPVVSQFATAREMMQQVVDEVAFLRNHLTNGT